MLVVDIEEAMVVAVELLEEADAFDAPPFLLPCNESKIVILSAASKH